MHRLPLLLVFLVVAALSLKSLREPDLWWQIRTGEWILENHQVPRQDVFSFTYSGAPWINIKWGFEVMAAVLTKVAGPESIFLLQALVGCLIFFFLLKAANRLKGPGATPSPLWQTALALLAVAIAVEYRFNGRPEMFSHLFTIIFIAVLLKYRQQPGWKILWLAPLQVVWANFHEAFGIGIVLIAVFCAGAWAEYFLGRKKGWRETAWPKEISALLVCGIAALLINPNGAALLTRPLDILGQVYENKYTTELLDFHSPEYWRWNTYLAIAFIIAGLAGTFVYFKKLKTRAGRTQLFLQHFGIGYLLTVPAFFYLALTAYRNLAFFVLVFTPFFLFGWHRLWAYVKVPVSLQPKIAIGFCISTLFIYGLVVSNKYYQLTHSRDKFGLQVLPAFNPIGAASYVQQQKLQGPCFSDYLTSSYLLWKLQPSFKTFIDLRDLDVFPPGFFNTFAEAVTYPEAFEHLDSTYHFNYIVLYRPQFAALHRHLYNQSNFKPVFADAVAVVYKRTADTTAPALNFSPLPQVPPATTGFINYVFNPAFGFTNMDVIDNDHLAASFFLAAGQPERAQQFALKASTNNIENYKGNEILGEVYFNKALAQTALQEKTALLQMAATAYQKSLDENDAFAPALLGLGAVYFQQQNYTTALEYFEKALEADKANLNACIYAGECCKYFIGRNTDAEFYTGKAIEFYSKADGINPTNPAIMLNLGLLYSRQNNCSQVKKYLIPVQDYPGLSPDEKRAVQQCLARCSGGR